MTMQTDFPVGSRVRGNAALHVRLGPTRRRDPDALGAIVGYETPAHLPQRHRPIVKWDKLDAPEAIGPGYLERVET